MLELAAALRGREFKDSVTFGEVLPVVSAGATFVMHPTLAFPHQGGVL